MGVTYEKFKEEFKTDLLEHCPDFGDFIISDFDNYVKKVDEIPGYCRSVFRIFIHDGIIEGVSLYTKGLIANERIVDEWISQDEVSKAAIMASKSPDYYDRNSLITEAGINMISEMSKSSLDETLRLLKIDLKSNNIQSGAETFSVEFYKSRSFSKSCDKVFKKYFI